MKHLPDLFFSGLLLTSQMPHQISANIGKYGGFGCEGIFGSTEYAADSTFCDSGQTTSAPLVPGRRPSIHSKHTHKTWTRAVHQFVNLGFERLKAIEQNP